MDCEKITFGTADSLYQFKVMPFALSNALVTFKHMMDSLLTCFKWPTCLCYLGNVIVSSQDFETQECLSAVLDVFP